MTRPDLSRLAPPGLALKPEKQLFGWGMALSVLFSLQFFTRFADAREKLYWKNGPQRELFLPPNRAVSHGQTAVTHLRRRGEKGGFCS